MHTVSEISLSYQQIIKKILTLEINKYIDSQPIPLVILPDSFGATSQNKASTFHEVNFTVKYL
jgi:hypothetical protein